MDDTGDFMTTPDPAFAKLLEASADMVQINQDQRPLKDGQMLFKGTYETLVLTVNGKSVIEARPPLEHMKATTMDGSKKYPAAMPFFFRIESVGPEIPGLCEALTDGKPGWRVMAKVKYFKQGEDYLRECKEKAWRVAGERGEYPPELQAVRDFITADGTLINQKWLRDAPGDQIKMKLRDGKDNIFRQENPDQPGMLLVQPSTPLILPNVQAVVWVDCKEDEETLPLPEGAPKDAKPEKRKVKRLIAYNTYECKGKASVAPDYDKNMCLSERKHANNDASKHQMVPIEEFASRTRIPPASAYFYVAPWYVTPWIPSGNPNAQGISMHRDHCMEGDFSYTFGEETTHNLVIRLNVFQWHGRPSISTDERYVVKLVCTARDKDRICGSYGITDLEAYEAIQAANLALPVHIEAKLWEGPTLGHPSNAPDVIRASDAVATVRGYYVYGIGEAVPDFLRYFRGPRSLKVSRDWVLKEFANWHTKNVAGRESLFFTPAEDKVDRVRRNPVNVFGGDKGVVVALGNGQLKNPNDLRSAPLYLGYAGEAMTLFTGIHDFYVLISHTLNDEEAACWAGPNPTAAPFADALIDTLKQAAKGAEKKFHYWIYALRKDAKRAPPKPRPQPFVAPTPAANPEQQAPASPLKREREASPLPVAEPGGVSPKRAAVHSEDDQDEDQEEEPSR